MADIKAGGMGSPNDAGDPGSFVNSMAAGIESALNEILDDEGRDRLLVNDNSSDTRDRRMLFCAIAQGVVNHLRANADAFKVTLHFTNGQVTSATISIATQ